MLCLSVFWMTYFLPTVLPSRGEDTAHAPDQSMTLVDAARETQNTILSAAKIKRGHPKSKEEYDLPKDIRAEIIIQLESGDHPNTKDDNELRQSAVVEPVKDDKKLKVKESVAVEASDVVLPYTEVSGQGRL